MPRPPLSTPNQFAQMAPQAPGMQQQMEMPPPMYTEQQALFGQRPVVTGMQPGPAFHPSEMPMQQPMDQQPCLGAPAAFHESRGVEQAFAGQAPNPGVQCPCEEAARQSMPNMNMPPGMPPGPSILPSVPRSFYPGHDMGMPPPSESAPGPSAPAAAESIDKLRRLCHEAQPGRLFEKYVDPNTGDIQRNFFHDVVLWCGSR